MTESEWLACTNPYKMWGFLLGKMSRRKSLLFACACCRGSGHLPTDERSRRVAELAEQFADGAAASEELDAAQGAARLAFKIAHNAIVGAVRAWAAAVAARKTQCDLVRDIIGNPFRPSPALPPAVLAWNDGTVRRIAQGIYEERAFGRLPILHDALLDAGCDDEDLMQHCRSEGPHVRGCWAVDLILGKE
jgi:hypothetical protein